MLKNLIAILLVIGFAGCEKKPTGKVFFISPQNGEEVKSPVVFKMGVEGMEVQPAGESSIGKRASSYYHQRRFFLSRTSCSIRRKENLPLRQKGKQKLQ